LTNRLFVRHSTYVIGGIAMLTKRYMTSVKNVPEILSKLQDGVAPNRFTNQHLRDLGFTSSNDRGIIPLLKDLGFLSPDGTPTDLYQQYRNRHDAPRVLAKALRDAYGDLFTISERPSESDRTRFIGKFKSTHNVSDKVANLQTATFLALLRLADLDASEVAEQPTEPPAPVMSSDVQALVPMPRPEDGSNGQQSPAAAVPVGLSYTIEIHLPASTDVTVYNAIFKSLREHLLG
jgi:hypothetical protein